ncbi:GNAT family N-acetyltransferase [Breoghania sp. L-A4]|uniref:GNAT family N-acetyltransferase n=1 Tax=Breoghania sp. L-A4 TaxID=2304600 RepID=UPI000E35E94C|nr:GNAT family N-acetyltransferase [Breoghania sp. L-A4]AXS40294.1 GNAT family N-acetyltransferase [Breoghania sp. L-A4]
MEPPLRIVEADRQHLGALVAMLHDDFLGQGREDLSDAALDGYRAAFAALSDDPNNTLFVALDETDAPVGMFQLTFLPGLSYGGQWRAQIEGVRTRADQRGKGIGARMMAFAIEQARSRGCVLVQLATNKARGDAHRFYERLGFKASHIGMKMML